MSTAENLPEKKVPLNHGVGAMPALGFGTLIPDPVATKNATKLALQTGFRTLDTSERYRTEKEVGEAIQEVLAEGEIKREDLFVITKLWNSNPIPICPNGNFWNTASKTESYCRPSRPLGITASQISFRTP